MCVLSTYSGNTSFNNFKNLQYFLLEYEVKVLFYFIFIKRDEKDGSCRFLGLVIHIPSIFYWDCPSLFSRLTDPWNPWLRCITTQRRQGKNGVYRVWPMISSIVGSLWLFVSVFFRGCIRTKAIGHIVFFLLAHLVLWKLLLTRDEGRL